ncbi:MAG: sortase [Candidatus Gracilibacteria bacterium]|nr:sortase [Candidatus Gracilibacteria bacterium]
MENKNTNIDVLSLLNLEDEFTNLKSDEIQETNGNNIIFSNKVNQESDIDILSEFQELENQEIKEDIKKESIGKIIINNITFFIKYLSTSSLIFIFLLGISNYNAYTEIARSYFNPEVLEQSKVSLLSSVNSTNIIQEDIPKVELKKENIGKDIGMVKNKTYHSMDKLINSDYKEDLNLNIDIVPFENRVIIPKIGKNIPLIDVKNKTVQNVKELETVFMNELSNGIIRYPGSAIPGEIGNSFIFGHSSNFPWIKGDYNDVFALLDNVEFGDEIIVYYNQKKYIFKIKEKKIIKPGDVSVLKKETEKPEISLMTCWPVGTTLNRMIVIGELIE